MSAGGYWGDPTHPPSNVSGGGLQAYEVVTVNGNGTVDLRNQSSRATRSHVAVPDGYTPSIHDVVLVADLGGNMQRPAITQVITATVDPVAALAARVAALEAPPAQCFLRKTASTTLALNSMLDVPFETEDYDPLGLHSGTSALVTVSSSGLYLVFGQVVISQPATGGGFSVIAQLEKNGTGILSNELSPLPGGISAQPVLPTPYAVRCAAGDTLNLAALTNGTSGTAATLTAGSTFAVIRLSPL